MKNTNHQKFLDKTNTLELIPVVVAEYKLTEKGTIDLYIPKFKNEKFANWFIPGGKSQYFIMHLDVIGSKVWARIDGVKTVEQICDELEGQVGEGTYTRVSTFISHLYDAGSISFRQLESLK
jgi:hypothetical protein